MYRASLPGRIDSSIFQMLSVQDAIVTMEVKSDLWSILLAMLTSSGCCMLPNSTYNKGMAFSFRRYMSGLQ